MNCSLIISTYNRPDALELTLKSILHQSILPNEILIADDGSDENTKLIIDKYIASSPVPIKHCWHEDKGFRLAKIRNRALLKAEYEYIIQIDGDVILHRDFIKHHLFFSKKGYFSRGSRVELTKSATDFILKNNNIPSFYETSQFENYKISNGKSSGFMRYLLRLLRKTSNGVLGCNMAYYLSDAKKINGFNNDFEGWGAEDDDFSTRLINSGVKMQTIKFGAILYHLWHKIANRDQFDVNMKLLDQVKSSQTTYCINGMNQI